jgi:RimJ/RimL family protein N-acetyltransferase
MPDDAAHPDPSAPVPGPVPTRAWPPAPVLRTDRLTLAEWRVEEADAVLDMYSRIEVVRWAGGPQSALTSPAGARERVEGWWTRAAGGPPRGIWATRRRPATGAADDDSSADREAGRTAGRDLAAERGQDGHLAGPAENPTDLPDAPTYLGSTDRPVGTALLVDLPASSPDGSRPPSGHLEIGWHLHPDAWGLGYATEAARAVLAHAAAYGVTEILAVTHPDNLPSQAVARRIGMRHMGRTREFYDTEVELFSLALG